ncbi:hypothetical protein DJ021_14140 [Phenylobacterium hankyongense]|uniref:DUF4402 domain-containing protein n=1 Tax=Phenylobacterium hankyongense TaxID=1813876 RepID=A0A328B1U3_9CAUL|nr:DUF4402 domain-containing protein [Phenylobacterium hankyongense]RAK60869.1 hypothetical protein DJ021_14140 [Phenylobacterium hankyongense]
MGRLRTIILGVTGAALSAAVAAAQTRAATGGSVTVMDPIALSQGAQMTQGAVARPGAGPLSLSTATYTLTGLGGETFNVTAPASIALHRAGGPEQLQLTLTPSQTTGLVAGPAGAPGSTTIGVTGSAPVSGATAGGLYVGEYGLTVAYP